jgi:nicotinamide mononucleotide transporter
MAGIFNVILASKGKAINFIPGTIRCLLYSILAFQNKYYGEFILNAFYYIPMQFYGFIVWTKQSNSDSKNSSIAIKKLSNKTKIIGGIVAIIFILIYREVLIKIGTKEPLLNSISTISTALALILMTKCYIEHWLLWTITNFASITLWIIALKEGSTDVSILIMFSAFTINGLYGMYNWSKLYTSQISKSNVYIDIK